MAVAALNIRRLGIVLAPLPDILSFCAFFSAGLSLRASNTYAFAIGYGLSLLLRWPALRAAQDRAAAWRTALRCAIVGFMALALRAGVLALLVQRCGWAPQLCILFAVAFGLAVTAPRWRSAAGALIVYAFVLRLIYAGSVEMMPEETYYWDYSRHLSFGYLDHPPMVAWLIRAATAVFGQTEFGVRAGALLCGAITSVFVYKLTRNLFGAAAALAALLAGAGAAVLLSFRAAHDAGCTVGRSVGRVALLPGARIDRQPIPGVVVCRHLPWHGNDFKIYHRAARARGGGLHAVGSAVAALVEPPRALCRRSAGLGHLFAGHHLERAASVGIVRVSNLTPPCGDAAIRPAQANRLDHRPHYPDRTAGRDRGAVGSIRRRSDARCGAPTPTVQSRHSRSHLGDRLVQFASRSEAGLDRRTLDGGAARHGLRHGESRSTAAGSRPGFALRGCPPSSPCC